MLTDFHGSNAVTSKIIGCAYTVAGELGHGFAEKVYENALAHELRKTNLGVRQQEAIRVFYDGIVVGEYLTDLVVEGKIIVEVKAVQTITNFHLGQGLNYLKATGFPICLLINFGPPAIQIRRLLGFSDRVFPCSSDASVPKRTGERSESAQPHSRKR